MQELINILNTIDDDYLIGLSNKGTLKRAYKELDTAEISAEYGESSVTVTVSGERCSIVNPLGESNCSCPSRSICRHIVTAILWLKNNSKSEVSEIAGDEIIDVEDDKKEPDKALIDELSVYPLKELQKAMKKTYYTAFNLKVKNGRLPEIEETSIISVNFPDENISVRLISPLEFSSCTCHSKELCKHKAAAILSWQIKHDKVKLDDIKVNKDNTSKIDVDNVHSTAEYVRNFLFKLLSDGLVRASENLVEDTEAAAVMCHNARLADCERNLREIGNRLSGYISHSPEFNADILFMLIVKNIILLNKIIDTNDENILSGYLGEFKNTYVTTDTIEILPIAHRNFSSAAGYEGEIYYFLNMDITAKNRFLSYSAVRPTFYEKSRRNAVLPAPWGLYGAIAEIMESQLKLENPKLSGSKISSSNDTIADIIEPVNLNQKVVYDSIYNDFTKMLTDTFSKKYYETDEEQLVLIAPKRCISSNSDEITQTHSIVVEDIHGGRLTVKARYRSDNKNFFSRFSKIGELMLEKSENQFVIFGNAYIENGRCFIYPIAIFDSIEYNCITSDDAEFTGDKGKYNYNYFSILFNDVKRLLCDIIQCGINSFDMYEQIKEYSAESGKMGMLMFSRKLDELYNLLTAKNHSYSSDNSKIIAVLSDIFEYITIGIRKTEYFIALNNLNSWEEDMNVIKKGV